MAKEQRHQRQWAASTAEAINRARSKTQTKAAGVGCEFMNRSSSRQNTRRRLRELLNTSDKSGSVCRMSPESESNDVMSGGARRRWLAGWALISAA